MAVVCNDIIKAAFRLAGVYEKGQTPANDENENARLRLNYLIEMLSTNGALAYQETNETQSITGNTGSYTIGSGATWDTTRPTRLTNVFVKDSNDLNYEMDIISNKEYQNITDKTITSSYPSKVMYDPGFATGTIYFWPVPSQSLTAGLSSWKQLSTYATGTTTVSVPPAYQMLLEFQLAVLIAPEYGKMVNPQVKETAQDCLNKIAGLNADQNTTMAVDPALVFYGYGKYNPYTDE